MRFFPELLFLLIILVAIITSCQNTSHEGVFDILVNKPCIRVFSWHLSTKVCYHCCCSRLVCNLRELIGCDILLLAGIFISTNSPSMVDPLWVCAKVINASENVKGHFFFSINSLTFKVKV